MRNYENRWVLHIELVPRVADALQARGRALIVGVLVRRHCNVSNVSPRETSIIKSD